jgi:arylsulfatase A-like enzyme
MGAYEAQADIAPPTPTLDSLVDDGVLFRNAYAYPTCSASRAALLTGRFGRRTGVGMRIGLFEDAYRMPLSEVTLPEMLTHAPDAWDTSMVGKWHMANFAHPDWITNPGDQGFAWSAGSAGNIELASYGGMGSHDYFSWEKVVNGTSVPTHNYATTESVDDALDRTEIMQEPWMLYLSMNAPHLPLHRPPDHLWSSEDLAEEDMDAQNTVRAMIEAMDTELGRLLDGIPPEVLARTTVVFVGDNGTEKAVVTPPMSPDHAKGSLFEGGTHVPLIVSGPAVSRPGSESEALVSIADIFPTVAELAGVDLASVPGHDGEPLEIDGISLVPYLRDATLPSQRDVLYTETFTPNGGPPYTGKDMVAVREARYKLMRNGDQLALFDLWRSFPGDGQDLLANGVSPREAVIRDRLLAQLEAIQADLVYDHTDDE